MKHSINDIKIKHIDLISAKEIDFPKIMVHVFGYKNTWFNRLFIFKKEFTKIYHIVIGLRKQDVSKAEYQGACKIRIPKKVDSLTFQCRLEMGNLRETSKTTADLIVDMIALACYTSQHKVKFNSDSILYKRFREFVSNQPLVEMMGLYNHIIKQIEESDELWNKLFSEMNIIDPDYEEAGGPAVLGRFSLLRTTKKSQQDFMVSYEEAFLLPYSLVQTNNLESSSASWLQNRMTEIKERNFKSKRQSH